MISFVSLNLDYHTFLSHFSFYIIIFRFVSLQNMHNMFDSNEFYISHCSISFLLIILNLMYFYNIIIAHADVTPAQDSRSCFNIISH